MGICCTSRSDNLAENYVRKVMSDHKFKCSQMNFDSIISTFSEYLILTKLSQKIIDDNLIPKLVDNSDKNETYEIHYTVIKTIMDKLLESINMYQVIFFFFPFSMQSDDKIEENLYQLFKLILKQECKYQPFKDRLCKYFDLCTWELNAIFISKCSNEEITRKLNWLNKVVYSAEKTKLLVNKILIKTWGPDIKDSTGINEKMFRELYAQYPFAWFTQVRDLFLEEYSEV